jgi:hypothetical protein
MPDLDQLIRDLKGAPPPAKAPEAQARRPWPLLALAATLLVAVAGGLSWTLAPEPYVALRGGSGEVQIDLRMVVERGGRTLRVSREGACFIGEQVFFRLASSPGAEVALWVDGPDGRERIAELMATPEPRDLESEQGMVSFEFERAGSHSFYLAPSWDDDCTSRACEMLTVEVR